MASVSGTSNADYLWLWTLAAQIWPLGRVHISLQNNRIYINIITIVCQLNATSFWRHNGAIITSCVRWGALRYSSWCYIHTSKVFLHGIEAKFAFSQAVVCPFPGDKLMVSELVTRDISIVDGAYWLGLPVWSADWEIGSEINQLHSIAGTLLCIVHPSGRYNPPRFSNTIDSPCIEFACCWCCT